jgi:hypothetical protein
MSITYCECVFVALVIQHAKRMPRIPLSSVVCLAVPCFYTYSHKRHEFWKNKNIFEQKKVFFLFSLQLMSETFLITRRIRRHVP